MKIGINTCCFPEDMRLEDCISISKDVGFESIEVRIAEMHNDKLTLHSEIDIEKIRLLLEKYQITIPSLTTDLLWKYSITDNDERIRNKAKEIVRWMIDAAEKIGAEAVLTVPGVVTDEVAYNKAYERAKEALKELGDYAQIHGIFIGVENVWNKFLLSPLKMHGFIGEIDKKYVKVYFDAANVLAYGIQSNGLRF